MATVIADITEGTIRRDTNGWSATRVFDVESTGGSPIEKPYNAILAIESAQNVVYGSPHPIIPGISVISLIAEHVDRDPDIYRVTVEYGNEATAGGGAGSDELGAETFSVSAQTISEETIYDARGVVLQTRYVDRTITSVPANSAPGLAAVSNPDIITEEKTQTHRVAVERPTFALTFTRIEPRDAFDAARLFNARVNSAPFLGLPSKTVLMNISSDEIDNGRHRVTYEAIYNPRTWMVEIRTSIDGRVPEDVGRLRNVDGLPFSGFNSAQGAALRDVYPSADFSVLALRRPPR